MITIYSIPVKTKVCLLVMCYLLFNTMNAIGKVYFISNEGNDSGPGNYHNPWSTFNKAVNEVVAGDTVFIREGTYYVDQQILLENKGNSTHWITFTNYLDEKVIVNADAYEVGDEEVGNHFTSPFALDEGVFQINDSENIRVIGINIKNSPSGGFNIRTSKNIEIISCSTNKTYSSGISAWYSDHITVLNNVVDSATLVENESPHEAISMGSVHGFEVAFNIVRNSFKEGIDAKQACANGSIHHNLIHDLNRQGIYIDGWRYNLLDIPGIDTTGRSDSLHHIEVYNNTVYNCSWGIVIGSEGGTVVDDIDIHHNIVYDNGFSGIYFADFVGNGQRTNISITNNTVSNCGLYGSLWSTGGLQFETSNVNHITIYNNIFHENAFYPISIKDIDTSQINIDIDYNIQHGDRNNVYSPPNPVYLGDSSIITDPGLINPPSDFGLTDTSLAIGNGNPDTLFNDKDGSRNDIGAIAFETSFIEIFFDSLYYKHLPVDTTNIIPNPSDTAITNIATHSDIHIDVYPNPKPINESLTIKTKLPALIEIVDMTGNTLYISQIDNGIHQVNTPNYRVGVYLVKVVLENGHIQYDRIVMY